MAADDQRCYRRRVILAETPDEPEGTRRGRITQTIDDLGAREDLIRYAVAAQLARLGALGVSDRTVGKAVSGGPTKLSHCLSGPSKFSNEVLRQLDEVIVALAPGLDHIGGLAQFAARMRDLTDRTSLVAHIPPNWTRDILRAPPDGELQVLIQSSALLTNFFAASRGGRRGQAIRDAYKDSIAQVVDRLVLIATGPPTPRGVEAQLMLGNLAKYAFDVTFDRLEDVLRYNPLGFRIWRALTKLVLLGKDDLDRGDSYLANLLKEPIAKLLSEAQQLRTSSIYPGRSLDLELAIVTPRDWLQPTTSASAVLGARARDREATLRERGTATMGLWQRACEYERSDDPKVRRHLRELIEHLGRAEQDRPEIASGLRWVAATLQAVMEKGSKICNTWPDTGEPWLDAVNDAVESLEQAGIPAHIRPGTKNLFRHVLLQNSESERRRAIDTLIAGGWTEPIARALGTVLRDGRTEGWVRIRALLTLGLLQHRSTGVARSLRVGCEQAYRNLAEHSNPPRALVTELHTALFAIGDCLGVEESSREARTVRDALRPILSEILELSEVGPPTRYPVARALAYMLTFTAQPRRRPGTKDLSQELLERLSTHGDKTTQDLSTWALGFRFDDDGSIRPLLTAAE